MPSPVQFKFSTYRLKWVNELLFIKARISRIVIILFSDVKPRSLLFGCRKLNMIEVPCNKRHIKVHIKYRSGTNEGLVKSGEVWVGFTQQMTLKQGLKEEVGVCQASKWNDILVIITIIY